jgi:cell division protein FtsQ
MQAAVRSTVKFFVVAVLGLYGAYRASEAVTQAKVLQIDRIVINGNERMSQADVMTALDGLRGENIVWADLAAWRLRLLASPWVREAALRRRLPSTVEITLLERVPMAIARLQGSLYLVDEQGVVIDEYGPGYADLDLPIVDGLSSPNGLEPAAGGVRPVTDEVRAELAARMIASLKTRPDIFEQVSQLDVSDRYNVALILAGDPAVIHVGDDQFLPRLESYVELSAALRERVPNIEHVDVRFENRIYVRPSGTGSGGRRIAVDRSAGPTVSVEGGSGGRR